jgi:hypothetical protein
MDLVIMASWWIGLAGLLGLAWAAHRGLGN